MRALFLQRENSMPKYFEIIGIKPTLDMEQIKAGFIRRIVSFHPDIIGIDKEKRDEIFAAFQYLQDPGKLKECYDAENPNESKEDEFKSESNMLVVPVVAQSQNSAFTDYATEKQFTKQIIIDYVTKEKNFSHSLKVKWDDNHAGNPCKVIKPKDDADHKIDVNNYQADDFVRIYVIAVSFFITDRDAFTKLANLILPLVSNINCVVNLLVDKLAAGSPSMAADFHERLFSATKKDVPVVARTVPMMMRYFSASYPETLSLPRKKTASKNNELVNKQPGTKKVFTIDADGNQIKVDAYAYRWKKRISISLTKISNQAPEGKIKDLLSSWLKTMEALSLDEIYRLVNCEIDNPTSILKENSTYSNIFFEPKSEISRVNKLLAEIKDMMTANKNPVITKAKMAR